MQEIFWWFAGSLIAVSASVYWFLLAYKSENRILCIIGWSMVNIIITSNWVFAIYYGKKIDMSLENMHQESIERRRA